jgi:hypothetical protein
MPDLYDVLWVRFAGGFAGKGALVSCRGERA